MDQIESGGVTKANRWTYAYYWGLLGGDRDHTQHMKLAQWLSANERSLDKKTGPEAIKLIAEEFPLLLSLTANDRNGRSYRLTR